MASARTISSASHPVLSTRALSRATLERQLLLRRSGLSAEAAVTHLLGLQAQNVKPPYFQLAARLEGFVPDDLSGLMAARRVARLVTLRSTIHTHTADDCLTLRPLVQAARDRELRSFRDRLTGVDPDRLAALVRELVEERPRPLKELREALAKEWPEAEPFALGVAGRCLVPLVQTTPRGLWGRAGQVTLTTAEHWFGRPAEPVPAPDGTVLRYLAAFGPASVKDMQVWSGLTRLREAFERLRPRLLTFQDESGTELFDLPEAPRPAEDTPAPPRFLPEYDNLLLSHADRSRVVPPAYRGRTVRGNQPFRTFLVDGFLAGIWQLTEAGGRGERGGRVTLTVEAFGALTPGQRAEVAEEGERVLAVMGMGGPYDIRFGSFSGPQG
ncbi:winged helix DNA-binding domain-containing protein [Streptomyces sp. NPDC057617]|uniref:winged helix DNA-binding domain-containing protein n=1 Tax=Streptomyces sp. NPDC057617 TaxID=3346184 RepID=UPI00369D6FD1